MTWNGELTAALGQAGEAYTKAWLDWQREVMRFVGARLDQDRLTQESLTECRSLADLTKAQADWTLRTARDYLDESTRLTQIASQLVEGAAAPFHSLEHRTRSARQKAPDEAV
jgi:hypothetical protein